MRNRVLLHKLKFNSHGDFDRSAQNSKTVTIAHLDMSSAVANTHYWSRQTVTTTFRGQTVRVTRFDMTWVGYGRTHCSDWADATELNFLPWEVKLNTATNRYEFAGFSQHYRPLTVGVKPTDWDTAWQWKYYTKYDTNFYWANSNSVPVTYPRGINNNTNDTTPYTAWDSNTQYYVADDGWEVNQIWVTDRMLTFGGWQSFETYGIGNTSAYMCGLVNGYRSLGVRLYTDGSYQSNWGYKGGRVGFAQLSTDTNRITSYCDSMNPTVPSGGHVNTYRSNVPFVENAARTQLINNGKWSVPTFCRLVAFTLDGVNYIGFLMGYENSSFPDMPYTPIIYAIEDLDDETLSPWGVEPPPGGGYSGPTSRPGGGNGTYTDTDDGVTVNGVNGGFAFGADPFGFKTYDTTGSTYSEVIRSIFSGTYNDKMVAQLNTGIVDCYGLAIPATSGSPMNITILGDTMKDASDQALSANVIVANQEFLDCGTIPLTTRYYDSFMDFDPYTKISISIPFIGKYEIPVNEVMYGSIGLKYRQDNQTGDLVAFVEGTNQFGDHHIIAMFSGNGKYTLPVTGAAKNNAVLAASLSAGGKVLGGAYGGAMAAGKVGSLLGSSLGPGGTVAGAVLGAGIGVLASLPDIQAGNSAPETGQNMVSLSGNQGYLGYLTPYIEITRTMYTPPETQGRDKGYPSNTTQILKDLTGFVKVKNLEMENIAGATEEEKAEILLLLSKGVYIYFPDAG